MSLRSLPDHDAADVRRLAVPDLLALFATLEAPAIAEMHGEYAACLLRQPGLAASVFGWAAVSNPWRPWLCKAFRPVDALSGRGYNSFRQGRQVIRQFPMLTCIAPSRYDGRPAYHLIYRAYHSLCGDINMVDEVRRLASGAYLGIGTWGFTPAQRRIALPFLLEGPSAPYQSDTGKPRRGFQPGRREIPGLTF